MEHHLWIDYDKEKKSFEYSPDVCRGYNVFLRFCCEPSFENCVIRQYSEPLIQRNNQPLIETAVLLNLDDEEKGRKSMERKLRELPLQPEARRWLIDRAMKDVRELFQCMPPDHNTLFLNFRVRANHVSVYYEKAEEEDVWMVPADEEKKKKKKKMDCSICLDEILIGRAEGLPCCHVFHEDCIKKWLRKSHCCPVCRHKIDA